MSIKNGTNDILDGTSDHSHRNDIRHLYLRDPGKRGNELVNFLHEHQKQHLQRAPNVDLWSTNTTPSCKQDFRIAAKNTLLSVAQMQHNQDISSFLQLPLLSEKDGEFLFQV